MRRIVILVLVLLLLGVARASEPFTVAAKGAVLIDGASGRVLFGQNENAQYPMASTTKVMTTLLALENASLDEQVTAGKNAYGVTGTSLYLSEGETLSMEHMLYGLMLRSGNDAAVAVAEHIAGSVPAFAEMMNAKAAALGCTGTHFANANGMPDANHYSTARDMAKIASYAIGDTRFRAIIGLDVVRVSYVYPAGRTEYCVNTNELLRTYPGCIGGKTGWTRAAAGCLTTAAKRHGRTLVAVVMHATDEDTRFSDAAKLLDYGFGRP